LQRRERTCPREDETSVDLQRQLANLDRAIALERVGGDEELLREIAALFLDEYPKMMTEIRAALEQGNAKALEQASHSLKGSVGNFGADHAYQAALRLETIGRGRDLSAAAQAYQDLVRALDSLRPALVALRHK
jgi:HPt (histidine-containing phosphotransfer) domain-containing protein